MEPTQEITQIVNGLPKDVLGEVLQYLKQIEKVSPKEMRL
jgi:hypothetical protein